MFPRLQKKWKVNRSQLILIICTFAIGGSLTGYAGRKLLNLFSLQQNEWWWLLYILIIILLWPMAVLLISIPFGQFAFFINYLKRIGTRVGIFRRSALEAGSRPRSRTPDSRFLTGFAIFASGAGSNAQKIIDYFRNHTSVKVSLIVCNNPDAGVLKIAAKENIPSLILEKEKFFRGNAYIDELKEKKVGLIILAGFLWKIPALLIKAYPGKIINIHPALLPGYGGKGMYGHRVHEAVIANKEKESGISIHYVDELYDHGPVIFQAKCPVLEYDSADSLAQRIQALEHEHYAKVIEEVVDKLTG